MPSAAATRSFHVDLQCDVPGGVKPLFRCLDGGLLASATRHRRIIPAFSLVNPVRNYRCTYCSTILLSLVVVSSSWAQESRSRQRSVRQSERVARASWQPTRPGTNRRGGNIQPVDHHQIETIPTPPPEVGSQADRSSSVIEGRVPYETSARGPMSARGPVVVPNQLPLDGQIELTPLHGGAIPCDAMPTGECGCGFEACTGCDAIGSCDVGGCGGCDDLGCSTCGELCSPAAWRPCVTLCLPQDGWISLEYLAWWQDGMSLPPLVTTSSDSGVARASAGVLGSPTTQILFGGRDVLDESFNGGRLRFGVWLDRCHTWGLGAEYFELGRETEGFVGASTGDPILARPFFNTETGLEDAELVAFPGVLTGTVGVAATSELVGAGFHLRNLRNCAEGCNRWLFDGCPQDYCSRTEAMIGYRYLELEESVLITEDLVSTDSSSPGTFDIFDRFETRNQFNGFDIGWIYRQTRGFWTFDTLLRLAVGNSRQTVRISGQTTVNDPNEPPAETLPGGLLAQTSNIGTYRQNEFAVVPEFNMNVGYQLTDHLRLSLGYSFIYWSNVVRPGEHISRDVNPNLLPPPADPFSGALRPEFAFDTTDYWVQGINFGAHYRW